MKGLLDFDKSIKNPKARFFLRSKFAHLSLPFWDHPFPFHFGRGNWLCIDIWVASVVKWVEMDQQLKKGKRWYELSHAFYAWLARNAVPYHESPTSRSGCNKFAKVKYEDFTQCAMPVIGRKEAKRLKTSYDFKDDDFTYPDESSCPSTDFEDSGPESSGPQDEDFSWLGQWD